MLKNEPTLAIGGVDTEENEHSEICPLSVYRSPRSHPIRQPQPSASNHHPASAPAPFAEPLLPFSEATDYYYYFMNKFKKVGVETAEHGTLNISRKLGDQIDDQNVSVVGHFRFHSKS